MPLGNTILSSPRPITSRSNRKSTMPRRQLHSTERDQYGGDIGHICGAVRTFVAILQEARSTSGDDGKIR